MPTRPRPGLRPQPRPCCAGASAVARTRARRRRSPVADPRRGRAPGRAARAADGTGQQARAARLAARDRGDAGRRLAASPRGEPVGRGAPALVRAAARAHGGAAARRPPGAAAGDPSRHGRARRRPADRPPALADDAARPRRSRAAGGATGTALGGARVARIGRALRRCLHRVPVAHGSGPDGRQSRRPRLVRHRHGDLAAVRRDPRVAAAEGRGDGRGARQDADLVVAAAAGDRPQLGDDARSAAAGDCASATSRPMRCA